MNIKLSKEAENSIQIMKDIFNKVRDLKDSFGKLDHKEANLVGGIVISMHSPAGDVGFVSIMGPEITTLGCKATIERGKAIGLPDLGELLGDIKHNLSKSEENGK